MSFEEVDCKDRCNNFLAGFLQDLRIEIEAMRATSIELDKACRANNISKPILATICGLKGSSTMQYTHTKKFRKLLDFNLGWEDMKSIGQLPFNTIRTESVKMNVPLLENAEENKLLVRAKRLDKEYISVLKGCSGSSVHATMKSIIAHTKTDAIYFDVEEDKGKLISMQIGFHFNAMLIDNPSVLDLIFINALFDHCADEGVLIRVFDATMESKYFPCTEFDDVQQNIKLARGHSSKASGTGLKPLVAHIC